MTPFLLVIWKPRLMLTLGFVIWKPRVVIWKPEASALASVERKGVIGRRASGSKGCIWCITWSFANRAFSAVQEWYQSDEKHISVSDVQVSKS